MIVGFDYQTPEVVAEEFAGLMKLKPALGQYLIYGPVPGTPFYERVIKDNLLQDTYTKDMELFYRRADGFRTMIKHPTLSPEEIEKLQQWCFDEDFQRLGPSIYRVLEARFLGWKKLKDSPNPRMREKAEYYAHELRYAYPVFLPGRLFGPNRAIRKSLTALEKELHASLGKPTFAQRVKSVVAVGAAMWTAVTLKLNLFQHPKLIRTSYREEVEHWNAFKSWQELQHKISSPEFSLQVELQHARQQVWMRLEGSLTARNVESLAHRLHESLALSKHRLVLDLNKLHWDSVESLAPLREKLAQYRSRICLVPPKLAAAHPEWMLLAGLFEWYHA
jgi:hypothetical protein